MSHRKDTDYLSVSARIRAMETRLLTRERMDRMIEARDTGEAMKVLAECGYPEGGSLDAVLAQARADLFSDMATASPEPKLVELFQLKYDYHNAKVLIKAAASGTDPQRLLMPGGRWQPAKLLEDWRREDLRDCSPRFREAVAKAQAVMNDTRDPQQADILLDRACYEEMQSIAKELDSSYLQEYVKLAIDVANLRTAVRVARMGREGDFLRSALIPGGSVSEQAIAAAHGEALADIYRNGPLGKAAEAGAKLTAPGSGPLTAFERECDNALTECLAASRRVPFGEEAVTGYLYAKESELTAIRTIFAGRAAGLDGDTIRARLRETYV